MIGRPQLCGKIHYDKNTYVIIIINNINKPRVTWFIATDTGERLDDVIDERFFSIGINDTCELLNNMGAIRANGLVDDSLNIKKL